MPEEEMRDDEEAPPSTRHQPKRVLEHGSFVTASKRAKPDQPGRELPALSSWVSCDNCEKWRRVAQEPTLEKWCCSDNPDSKHNSCDVPQEMSNVAIDRELGLAPAAPSHRRGHCEHRRQRSQCRACGGGSICQHGRQRNKCKECGGSSICQHGRIRSRCKECGGVKHLPARAATQDSRDRQLA